MGLPTKRQGGIHLFAALQDADVTRIVAKVDKLYFVTVVLFCVTATQLSACAVHFVISVIAKDYPRTLGIYASRINERISSILGAIFFLQCDISIGIK